jgi:hypothetical protein
MRARGSRKKAISQNVPGDARIQNTAGFFRQLSKMKDSAQRRLNCGRLKAARA